MNKFVLLAVVAAAGAVNAADGEGLVEERRSNPWHLRIGPVMAPRVRVKVSGPRFALPALPGNGTKAYGNYDTPLPAPKADGYAVRTYDDGMVGPDVETQNDGHTWNWSANNINGGNGDPAQYSFDDQTMTFHTKATSWQDTYTTHVTEGGSRSESDRDILLGLEAMGGWTFYDDQMFDAAVDFGFRYYGSDDLSARSRYDATVTTMRQDYRQVDTYKVDNWQPGFPVNEYASEERGPGPSIRALPEDQKVEELGEERLHDEKTYFRHARTRLDYYIWDLRLGPTLGWKVTDYLMIRGGVYGLLGLVDARLKTDVQSDQGNARASKHTCDPLFGMAFSLSAELSLTDNIFLYGGAEYDWWTDSVSLRTGGAKADLDLSDFTVSAGLGIEF